MVMEFIFGKTKGSMLAYGKITKCMVMAFSLGLMVECIMEVTQTEKNMVLVHMNGLINENSLVIGRMANRHGNGIMVYNNEIKKGEWRDGVLLHYNNDKLITQYSN